MHAQTAEPKRQALSACRSKTEYFPFLSKLFCRQITYVTQSMAPLMGMLFFSALHRCFTPFATLSKDRITGRSTPMSHRERRLVWAHELASLETDLVDSRIAPFNSGRRSEECICERAVSTALESLRFVQSEHFYWLALTLIRA